MQAQFQNARKRFVTSKTDTVLHLLLTEHLGDAGALALSRGGVWLDKKRVLEANHQIKAGKTLIVYMLAGGGDFFKLEKSHIVFEDKNLLVVNKPAGITAVADRSCYNNNMTYAVEQYYKQKDRSYIPNPINRLDFMVSGLMMFAKHKQAEKELFRLSQNRKIYKYYHAEIEKRENPPQCMRVQDKLGFTNKCQIDDNGKASESLFLLRESTEDTDIYGVVLLTGRRHQIRFHAAKYLAPICNDSLYGPRSKGTSAKTLGLTAVGLNFKAFKKRYRVRINP